MAAGFGANYSSSQPSTGSVITLGTNQQYIPPLPTSKTTSIAESKSNFSTSAEQKTTNKNTKSTQRETGTIDYLDPNSRAAYNNLLSALQAGGTNVQRAALTELQGILSGSLSQAGDYSKSSARSDASRALSTYGTKLKEEALAPILQASEQAGTYGDSVAALFAQRATEQYAASAAQLELEAIQQYANISSQFTGQAIDVAQILANDPVLQATEQLLGIGKGSVEVRNLTTTVDETVNEIINSLTTNTGKETSATKAVESTQYSTPSVSGGSGGFLNSGGVSTSKAEQIALLNSLLGPNQNLQDLADYRYGSGTPSFNAGTASGERINNLIKTLGLSV